MARRSGGDPPAACVGTHRRRAPPRRGDGAWRWSRVRGRAATSGRFSMPFCRNSACRIKKGIALMCIAEALLRIPDDATADRLIAEQLATGDWSSHAGKSESLFVNASTWGLMLTGGILELDPSDQDRYDRLDAKVHAQGRRAAGASRGAPRDAHHRRRIRRRTQHRGGAGAQRARTGGRACAPSTCWARARERSRMRERYLQSYEHAIDVIGAAGGGPARRTKHRAFPSSSRRSSRATRCCSMSA